MMSFFEVVPDTWLKLNQDETPEYKGKPYLDATPTVLTKFWLVFPIGVTLAYLYGGKQEVYTCFNPDVLWSPNLSLELSSSKFFQHVHYKQR